MFKTGITVEYSIYFTSLYSFATTQMILLPKQCYNLQISLPLIQEFAKSVIQIQIQDHGFIDCNIIWEHVTDPMVSFRNIHLLYENVF